MIILITFACKKIKYEDIVRCSFELNKTEYNILMFLLGRSSFYTISQIAKKMKLNRTTIQKAMKTLLRYKLVRRRQKNLLKGGYIFLYKASNKDEIKNRIQNIVKRWYEAVENKINTL